MDVVERRDVYPKGYGECFEEDGKVFYEMSWRLWLQERNCSERQQRMPYREKEGMYHPRRPERDNQRMGEKVTSSAMDKIAVRMNRDDGYSMSLGKEGKHLGNDESFLRSDRKA